MRLNNIRDQITRAFTLSEIEDMCLDLGIRYEDLPGGRLTDKARELVMYCERNGMLQELVQYCEQNRPALDWTQIQTRSNVSLPSLDTSLVNGPMEGELWHDSSAASAVIWQHIGANLRNFMAEVTFINPYSAKDHAWDMNLFFRFAHRQGYRIGISSTGAWSYGVELPEWKSLKDSKLDLKRMNLEEGEINSLRVIAYEAMGCFYLNDYFVGELDLSDLYQIGDIAVAIGSHRNHEQEMAITRFRNFSVFRIYHFEGCP